MKEIVNRLPLSIQVSGDPESGEFLAAYLCIVPGLVHRTQEVVEGLAFADYDSSGKLLGIELLDYCEPDRLIKVVKDESETVRTFIRWALLHKHAPAWKSVVGTFSVSELMKQVDAEGRAIREQDREEARRENLE